MFQRYIIDGKSFPVKTEYFLKIRAYVFGILGELSRSYNVRRLRSSVEILFGVAFRLLFALGYIIEADILSQKAKKSRFPRNIYSFYAR